MRQPSGFLFVDLQPAQPWVAVASGLETPLTLESISPLPLADITALRKICAENNPKAKYTRAIVGAYPPSRFLRHAILENPSKAREANFFEEYLKSNYQVELSESGVMVLNPATGLPIDLEKVVPKEIIFAGAKQADWLEAQNKVVEQTVYPNRLEMGTLSTIGGIMHYLRVQQIGSSAVVLEWGEEQSIFAVCSAKRIELLRVIPFGNKALLQEIKADLGLKDDASAQKILAATSFDFVEMGALILKRLIKELQASVGFFEVQTGQALKHFVVTLLPPRLAWVEQVLSNYLGLGLLNIDYEGWANTLGIKGREGGKVDIKTLTREHLGLFSLMVKHNTESDGEKRNS